MNAKYNFQFNRSEAEVILEILEHWKENILWELERTSDLLERNSVEVHMMVNNNLIEKITRQINTKKRILNFITNRPTLSYLSASLNVDKKSMVEKLTKTNNNEESKILEEKVRICDLVIERILNLPHYPFSEIEKL